MAFSYKIRQQNNKSLKKHKKPQQIAIKNNKQHQNNTKNSKHNGTTKRGQANAKCISQ